MKSARSILLPLILLFPIPATAQTDDAAPSVFDQFTELPAIVCQDIPFPEWPKFKKSCSVPYVLGLDDYLLRLEAQKRERFEALRAKTWDWMTGRPPANCQEKIPPTEFAKFYCGVASTSTGSDQRAELSSVRRDRARLAARIAELHARKNQLTDRQAKLGSTQQSAVVKDLEALLDGLAAMETRAGLMQRLSRELTSGQVGLPTFVALKFARIQPDVSITNEPGPNGSEIGRTRAAQDIVIQIDTTEPHSAMQLILHTNFGLGYAPKSQILPFKGNR